MLAFDGRLDSVNSLSSYLEGTLAGIVAASRDEPEKVAIVLSDGSGDDNTFALVVRDGEVTVIDGLPDPHNYGELDPDLREYDMTNSDALGSFLLWARAQYPSVTQTTVSYVGHGTFLMPETEIGNIQTPADAHRMSETIPLPSHWAISHDYTDHSPEAIISPYDLAQTLKIGTDNGANPIQLLDLSHCFGASIEEFYELSNPDGYGGSPASAQPFAEVMVGSPSYIYFAPHMPGETLTAFDPTDDAPTLANKLISTYDRILNEADLSDEPDNQTTVPVTVEHPRVLVAVDSSKIPQLKSALDDVAFEVLEDWDRNKLLTSYRSAAKYDTDFCEQDGLLQEPDALVDVYSFLEALSEQHIDRHNGIVHTSDAAMGLLAGVGANQLVLTRTVQAGTPWHIEGAGYWEFPGKGISEFMPLVADEIDGMSLRPFQTGWYTHTVTTENPQPYKFVQKRNESDKTWADVLHQFLSEEGEIETSVCTVPLPPPLQDGEIKLVEIQNPSPGTVSINSPIKFSATMIAENEIYNAVLRFVVTDSSGNVVYEEDTATGTILPNEETLVEMQETLIVTTTSPLTVSAIVNATDMVTEEDEDDNRLDSTFRVSDTFPNRPILTATLQTDPFITDLTQISLETTLSHGEITVLRAVAYQYEANGHAQFVGTVRIEDNFATPTLNLSGLSIAPGQLHLFLWASAGSDGPAQQPAELLFNYTPDTAQSLEASGRDEYVWLPQDGDALTFRLETDDMYEGMLVCVTSPLGRAVARCDASAVHVPNARKGRYRISVIAPDNQAIAYRLVAEDSSRSMASTGTLQYLPLPALVSPESCDPLRGECELVELNHSVYVPIVLK